MSQHYLQIRVKEQHVFAWIAQKVLNAKCGVAITFGSTIYLYDSSTNDLLENVKWLRHEIKHVEQYRKYGLIRFVIMYIIESIKHGYYNNKYEVEARNNEIFTNNNRLYIVSVD